MLGYVFDCRFVSLRVRSSKVSVVFDFNASLNEIIPAPSTTSMVVIQNVITTFSREKMYNKLSHD